MPSLVYYILFILKKFEFISIFGLSHGSFKKCLHSLDHVICVFHTSCLIWGMHGELSVEPPSISERFT